VLSAFGNPMKHFSLTITIWRTTAGLRCAALFCVLCFRAPGLAQDTFLSYSTYLGGDGADKVHAIATDEAGNVYLTGETFSSNLTVTAGTLQPQHAGIPGTIDSVFGPPAAADAFVMKLGPDGDLIYSTYLGGSAHDVGVSIAVDDGGSAYVLGTTDSADFAVTAGALATSFPGRGPHLFVAKLNPQGSALVYATFLGGGDGEAAGAITMDSAGNAYVTGATSSPDFPITPGAFEDQFAAGALRMPFVAMLSATGATLEYSTFLGGSRNGMGRAIAVDADGGAFVAGTTSSADFPVTPGALNTAGSSAFAVKVNASGTALHYAARFGGENEIVSGIAIDSEGNAWIAGSTDSGLFPVTAGALEQVGGGYDVWAVKLNATASAFLYASRWGGAESDLAAAIAVDAEGSAYVAGVTSSEDFPGQGGRPFPASQCFLEVNSPFPPPKLEGSCGEAFLAKLDPAGVMVRSTIVGGTDMDAAAGVSVGADGNAFIAGATRSNNFPTTQHALSNRRFPASCRMTGSPTFSVSFLCEDAFVTKVSIGDRPAPPPVEALNLGSLSFAPVAPESVIKLIGLGIGPPDAAGLQLGEDGRVTTELLNTRVLFDGVAAPLFLISADEINAAAPASVSQNAQTRIDIERDGEVAATLTAGTAEAAPALLTLDGTGSGPVAAINQDGSVNGTLAPASAGSVIALYVVGMGRTGEVDGSVAGGARDLAESLAPVVRIGGEESEVLYAGLAPGLVTAAIQINVRVPAVPAGNASIVVLTRGYATQPGTTIAIQ
jgi:uncharacterized protein (TIGR03437 family)